MRGFSDEVAEILLTPEQIAARLDVLAGEIGRDYRDRDLTVVGVLSGSVLFLADLLRRLPLPLRLDHLGISSYRGSTRPQGEWNLTRALALDVRDRDVLVVDDILDTGRTLRTVRQMIEQLGPRSLRFCVFLEKEISRQPRVTADYVAFQIPDQFVVGYGLDYQERFRNLPYVATLKPEALAGEV